MFKSKKNLTTFIIIVLIAILIAISIALNQPKKIKEGKNVSEENMTAKQFVRAEEFINILLAQEIDACPKVDDVDTFFCFSSYYFSEAFTNANFNCSSPKNMQLLGDIGFYNHKEPIFLGCEVIRTKNIALCSGFNGSEEIDFCQNLLNSKYNKTIRVEGTKYFRILFNAFLEKNEELCNDLTPEGNLRVNLEDMERYSFESSVLNTTRKEFYKALCKKLVAEHTP